MSLDANSRTKNLPPSWNQWWRGRGIQHFCGGSLLLQFNVSWREISLIYLLELISISVAVKSAYKNDRTITTLALSPILRSKRAAQRVATKVITVVAITSAKLAYINARTVSTPEILKSISRYLLNKHVKWFPDIISLPWVCVYHITWKRYAWWADPEAAVVLM